MKYGSLLGWGIVIYALLYLTWSGLVIHGIVAGILPRVIILSVLVVAALIAGRALRFDSWKDIVPYSLGWVLVAGGLDVIFSVPMTGWQLYLDWNLWVGYALLAIVPLFASYTRSGATVHHEYT